METRGIMGGFYRISEWIMRLSAINLLWLFSSLPFFYLLLTLMLTPADQLTADYFRQWFLLVGIVSPFTLVPASAAMFSVARKWVTGDVDVPLWKTYWRGYKENYKQSMVGGLIFAFLAVVLSVNYTFYLGRDGIMQSFSLFFIVLMVFLAAAFLNFLSIMVHLHMGIIQIIKNSLLITIGQPINSIMLLVMNVAILYISSKYSFLIVFFMGSVMAMASFWNFHRGFTKIQSRYKTNEEEAEEDEEDETEEDEEDVNAEDNEPGSIDDSDADRATRNGEPLALEDVADLPADDGKKRD